MSTPKKRFQVVVTPEIEQAITRIRQEHPGLVTDSALLTFALIEYARQLDRDRPTEISAPEVVGQVTPADLVSFIERIKQGYANT